MYPLRRLAGVSAVLAAASLLLLPVTTALATTVEAMSFEDLTRRSSSIVHGKVLSSSSRWNNDHSMIVTEVRIEVLETLKGAPGGIITVTQPGGQVGKVRVDVPGAAAYRAGQETVLFLAPDRAGGFSVAGLSRGRFDVRVDEKTGERTVLGMPAVDSRSGEMSPSGRGGTLSASAPSDLSRFLSDIRSLVDETSDKN